jgi:hypothetical protein
MNRKLITGMLIVLTVASLSSCITKPVVWDDSYPEKQTAVIGFTRIVPDSYNGIPVTKWRLVKIPAGEASIGGVVNIPHGGVIFVARDMEFTCYLEAGKEYMVVGASKDMLWGVNLTTKSGHVLEFIPFKEQPVFN